MKRVPISVQLYTLRDQTEKDFEGTLEKVATIGYEGVEFAGYGNKSASQIKELLQRLGLKASGSHVGIDQIKNNLEEVIAFNKEIGNKYIICPWAKPTSKEEVLELASVLQTAGEKCKEHGLTIGYHNHATEFEQFDGQYALDILFENTDPELVVMELDTYWVKFAGIDPIEYLKKYAGRCPLVHQKDMTAGEERTFTEVGEGIMDIKGIYEVAKAQKAEWFIVEQDKCIIPSLESIEISFNNLKKMGIA